MRFTFTLDLPGPTVVQAEQLGLAWIWGGTHQTWTFRTALVDIRGWAHLILCSRITSINRPLSSIAAHNIWKPRGESRLLQGLLPQIAPMSEASKQSSVFRQVPLTTVFRLGKVAEHVKAFPLRFYTLPQDIFFQPTFLFSDLWSYLNYH